MDLVEAVDVAVVAEVVAVDSAVAVVAEVVVAAEAEEVEVDGEADLVEFKRLRINTIPQVFNE